MGADAVRPALRGSRVTSHLLDRACCWWSSLPSAFTRSSARGWGLRSRPAATTQPRPRSVGVRTDRIRYWLWIAVAFATGMVGALVYLQKAQDFAGRRVQRHRLDRLRHFHRRHRRRPHHRRSDRRRADILGAGLQSRAVRQSLSSRSRRDRGCHDAVRARRHLGKSGGATGPATVPDAQAAYTPRVTCAKPQIAV